MRQKTTGFDLVILGKCPLARHFYINYHLVSYLQSTHDTSRVKTQSYFKDQTVNRCEVQEMRRLTIFFEILYTLFYKNKSVGFGKKLRIS